MLFCGVIGMIEYIPFIEFQAADTLCNGLIVARAF